MVAIPYFWLHRKVYNSLELSSRKYSFSWWVDIFIFVLILLSVIAIILESVPWLRTNYRQAFYYFEIFTVVAFTIEYLLRLWASVESPVFNGSIVGRVKYIFSFYAIIDLLAILPFYLGLFIFDLRFLRILRKFRIVRILKILRFVDHDPVGHIHYYVSRRKSGTAGCVQQYPGHFVVGCCHLDYPRRYGLYLSQLQGGHNLTYGITPVW